MKRKTAFGIDAGFFPFRDFLCPTHVFLRFYFEIHSTYTIFVGKLETPMNKISDLTHIHVKLKKQGLKDLVFICLGILLYSFGYTAFILPDQIVMGGASGIAALLYYGFKIPPAISIWSINIIMVLIAFRTLGRQFTVRTVVGVTILSGMIGVL